jgi:uncharacterized membrane protein
MSRKYLLIHIGIILCSILVSILMLSKFPDQLAIHWNISGEADGYASKYLTLFLIPAVMVLILLAIWILPLLKSLKSDIERFSETYYLLATVKLIFFAYVHVILIKANLEQDFNMAQSVLGGIALMFIFIGNYLPKIRKNQLIGIRLPWTIADENVWFHTHRLAGKLVITTAFFVFIGIFLGLPLIVGIFLLLASLLIPTVYSYFIYRRLKLK